MYKMGAAVVTTKSKDRHTCFSHRRVSVHQENEPTAWSTKVLQSSDALVTQEMALNSNLDVAPSIRFIRTGETNDEKKFKFKMFYGSYIWRKVAVGRRGAISRLIPRRAELACISFLCHLHARGIDYHSASAGTRDGRNRWGRPGLLWCGGFQRTGFPGQR